MRRCCRCRKLADLTEFRRDSRYKDGYAANCTMCEKMKRLWLGGNRA